MTKSELIEILGRKRSDIPYKDIELAVKAMLEQMSESLAYGERIEIRGFGSFSLHFRPPGSDVIPRRAMPSRFQASMCRISSLARNCANGSTTAMIMAAMTFFDRPFNPARPWLSSAVQKPTV